MAAGNSAPRAFEGPESARFRILSIDGGGIRGLIPAMILTRLEELITARSGPPLAEAFDLISGTSTGGLIALGLAMPRGENPPLSAAEMLDVYRGDLGRRVFRRSPATSLPLAGRVVELFRPRFDDAGLKEVLGELIGSEPLSQARCELLVTSYDMQARAPRFFKRWREESKTLAAVDAAVATASAPTYFPAHELGREALIDGGVFANNPTVAAIIEALKRTDGEPLVPADLLVVSLGTGHHETGFEARQVRGWGALDWVLPKHGEPPLIGAMLDGQSDSSDHWAHILLNHVPGEAVVAPEQMGAGPRYYRYQPELEAAIPLDATSDDAIDALLGSAEALIAAREEELVALADALAGPRLA